VKERYLTVLRSQATLFVDPAGLLTAAAVATMEEPQLPCNDKAFTVLGTAADITRGLRSLWGRWQREAADGWDRPDKHSWIVHYLVDGISSRRKGRDQALAAATALLANWVDRAQQTAAAAGAAPEVLVTVTLSDAAEAEKLYGRGRKWLDGLGAWELGVLITYLAEADWGGGVVTVRVPELIADRLLDRRSPLACTPHQGAPSSAEADSDRSAAAADGPIGPGIFDDTPIAERRPLTAGHLQALRAASGHADQLYLVFSAEQGAEVVPLTALEERCRKGWQGIIVAGASDMPGHLIEPWKAPTLHKSDGASDQAPPSVAHTRDHRDPSFGEHLGVDDGLRAMERRSYSDDRDREHSLRCLAMARGVKDLRTLDGGYDRDGRRSPAFPYAVWHALLAMSTVDLRPFRAPGEDRWDSGSGIPLAPLADVQIYTTNADPLVQGKGHSPDCRHAGDRGVSRHDDLLTLEQLLRKEDVDWCGKCGGYAIRRLTSAQVAYYRAAHRLHNIATTLRGDQPPTHYALDTSVLISELDELATWRLEDLEDGTSATVADTWRWKRIVDDLSAKAHEWDRASSGTSG
jgi:hypothetical protein